MKKYIAIWILLIASDILWGQKFNPGKERWQIKTSVTRIYEKKDISLIELLQLQAPIQNYQKNIRFEFQDQRFPASIGRHHLREGDIITTYGYILLVAIEKNKKGEDGDYHIQIRTSPLWADSCLIIEATFPPFINGNNALQDSCRKVRDFFDHFILKGKSKVCFGTNGFPAPYVKITGQLFFDAYHMNTPPRGKQNCINQNKMKSYTCWEIHPIIAISMVKNK